MANQILKSILATKKRKDLLIAPAGAGKSTAAARLGRFIMSPADVQAAKSFTILSGAARAKKGVMSAGLQNIIQSVNDSGGKVSYLYAPNSEIRKRRYGRLDGGPVDTRSMKQLSGTLRAPMNQFDFIKGVKGSSSNFGILRGSNGYVPNFAGGALEDAIQREQAAGLPVNQIRINQSGKLRNAQNPMGLAVTNTRDEPTGAIPNFAATDNSQKSSTDVLAKLFMLQTVLTGVTAAFSDTESTMGKFASNVTTASMALMSMAMLRGMGGGQPLTQFGGAYAAGRAGKQFMPKGADGKFTSVSMFGRLGASTGKGVSSIVRLLGPLGTGLTKVVPFVGRLVPILGQALFAFQALNAITGGALGKGLKSLMTSVGEALNIVDTPAEKTAKAFDKISESANKALASGAFGGNEAPFSEFLKRMTEAEKERIQQKTGSDEEDAEKLRAAAVAKEVSYLSFSQNKALYASMAQTDRGAMARTFKETGGTTVFEGGVERGLNTLQRKAIEALDKQIMLQFSSKEAQEKFSRA